ncbi:uncharacterized protein EV420DRAFT_1316297 [Desarmillaria tabescens]|uniref:Protein kinase domain-containing protein n=1 Tax=Armillaria tabescens TaxID=1929756 RepID=A0AA39MLT7_ARMTA|nr:uncharacterized protein EV420DRAFT_1316297 [Desarmillaria tabescens]KAK0439052.1 hypothetical protein EV420DRAFT_1316297 [Desarmillaria tabescens]
MRPAFPFENNSVKGCETRGQISCYAGFTMMLQYRSHLFTILICGRFARFIRWDRSGAIVSKRFDYTEDPNMIFEYYKRFAQLTPSQRGKDPTVSPIVDNGPDAIIARTKFGLYDTDMWHGESGPKAKREINIEDQKLFRINMTLNGQARRFVVCAPKFDDGAFSPFGRSTRRSLAIDLDTSWGILFMKDYWREDSARTAKESDIYGLLAQHKVPYVAEMEAGGDIPDMITITQEHVGGPLSHRFPDDEVYLLPTLQAHRIFLKTVGRDLTTFCSVKGLVTCIADAMEAHQAAFDRACILHRDISVGNIMITPDHRGFLIDWDHCVILNNRGDDKRICRTGTWQFMSAHLLASYGTVHTLVDDRESSVWVLLYVTLRHTRNSFLPTKLHHNLKLWFEDSVIESRGETGGEGKYGVLTGAHKVLPSFDVYGLDQLIRELVDVFAVRYEPEPTAENELLYEQVMATLPHMAALTPKGMRLTRMEKLNNPTWLCNTLRRHAEDMKVPAKGFGWCNNACYSDDEWRGSSQKRKATTERLETKRLKGICATTHSIYFEVADDKKKTQEE